MERIGIIGSGRAGSALGAALAAAGYPLVGVTARSQASLDRAARLLPGVPVTSAAEVADAADIVVLAVPDDVIAAVARELPTREDQYVVHLSGAHGLSVLAGGAAVPVALHPPMTFTGTAIDVARLAGVTFTATAPDDARPLVERLVKDLGAGLQWIGEEHRALYHAGIAHGANHLVTLLTQSLDALSAAGIADPAATMRPLLVAMLDNTLQSGHGALTGPIARGDVETVRAHLAALRELPGRTVPTYVELARATVELVAEDGRIDQETTDRLRSALQPGETKGQDKRSDDGQGEGRTGEGQR